VRDRSSSSREIVNNEILFCEISITRESDLNRRLTFLLQFPTLSRQMLHKFPRTRGKFSRGNSQNTQYSNIGKYVILYWISFDIWWHWISGHP